MVSEWEITYVKEAPIVIGDGNYSSKYPKAKEFLSSGVPFISASDMTDGTIRSDNFRFISHEQHATLTKGHLLAGDVLVVTRGNGIGDVAYVNAEFSGANINAQLVFLRADEKIFHNKFLYYLLSSKEYKALFVRYGSGSAQPQLPIKALSKIPLRYPSYQYQKAIAHVLGALDDRIELNRRMNETLEGMAQALFKSWFVDFAPVIDNALALGKEIPESLRERAAARAALGDKRQPLPEEIRTLFPNEFTHSDELGWIPMGWENSPICNHFKLLGGHAFKSGKYVDDGLYGVVTIKNVQDGNFVQKCANRTTELPGKMKEHCKLKTGDVLLSLTGNVGRVCVVSQGKYLLNQRVAKIVGADDIPRSFAYFFFRQSSLFEMMITIAKGTAQQNLSPIETARLKQVLPSNPVIEQLSGAFDKYFNKIISNTGQSQTLSSLRDTLLPKLLSGEIRIPDAEKMVKELAL